MELNEKQFIAGFNSGYLLAEYDPQLLTSLLKNIQPIDSYISGMSFGQKEYELGLVKNHLNELTQIRQVNRDEKYKGRD
ncbi:MAG: hypothetical protein IPO78_10095 [Saprospiraceae bacterium]|nr:hypothetical protein [Saprospiraceae bacterium]MBK8451655.1 hypothetical protein [Saprospiraceae bacterium]MBK9721950.1 hypothetical protein [Saprospiraceae bacterium]